MKAPILRFITAVLGLVLVCGLVLIAPVSASASKSQPTTPVQRDDGHETSLVNTPHMTVDPDGPAKPVVVHPKGLTGTQSQKGTLAASSIDHSWSGSWRTRKMHGCVTVVNKNLGHTLFGHKAYALVTKQHFCWGPKHVTRLHRSWDFLAYSNTFSWDKWLWSHMHFFKKRRTGDGRVPGQLIKHSGHIQDRRAQVSNEGVWIFGHIGDSWPLNRIHVYAHGVNPGRHVVVWMSQSIRG